MINNEKEHKSFAERVREGYENINMLNGGITMDLNKLYCYEIKDLAMGIVEANNEEEARKKVYDAYSHDEYFDPYDDDIEIWGIEPDPWFADNPDVFEIKEI